LLDHTKTLDDEAAEHEATDNEKRESESHAVYRGTLIHRALELFCKSGVYPLSDQLFDDVYSQIKTELITRKPGLLDDLQSYLQEAITCYSDQALASVFDPAAGAQTFDEMPLMYKTSSQPVYGIVDRVIKHENNVIIIDYKSNRLHGALSLNDIALQFKTQLDYYRDGARLLWPDCEIKTGILFTHYQEIIWL
jgi:ATP-dependent exoDNAse (exonuclease V) beta subunit